MRTIKRDHVEVPYGIADAAEYNHGITIARYDDSIPGECYRKAMLADLSDTDEWEVDLSKFMATAGTHR